MDKPVTVEQVLLSLNVLGVPPCGSNEFINEELQRKCVVYDALLKAQQECRDEILSICRATDLDAYLKVLGSTESEAG